MFVVFVFVRIQRDIYLIYAILDVRRLPPLFSHFQSGVTPLWHLQLGQVLDPLPKGCQASAIKPPPPSRGANFRIKFLCHSFYIYVCRCTE